MVVMRGGKVNEKKKVGRCGLKGVRNLQRYLRYGKVTLLAQRPGKRRSQPKHVSINRQWLVSPRFETRPDQVWTRSPFSFRTSSLH